VRTLEAFIKGNPNYEPDLVFLYARPLLLSPTIFELLRHRWSCPLLGLNLDDKTQFPDYKIFGTQRDNYKHWAGYFDLNLCSNRVALDLYTEAKLPVYYMPEGCARNDIGAVKSTQGFDYGITFAGAVKPERLKLVTFLNEMSVPINTFGRGWPGSNWVENLNGLFRSSQINLGIGSAAPAINIAHLKGRDVECPAAGACYLTSFNWELADLFEINKEILCYRNFEELIEILSYYRKRPEECLKIAHAAHRRAMDEHTWEMRFTKLFKETRMLA
jgi:hypothetical protein